MQVTQTTFEDLHHKTRARVPTSDENARVFLARNGNRLVGTATVSHDNGCGWIRSLVVNIQADTFAAEQALQEEIRDKLSYLHRRFVFVS